MFIFICFCRSNDADGQKSSRSLPFGQSIRSAPHERFLHIYTTKFCKIKARLYFNINARRVVIFPDRMVRHTTRESTCKIKNNGVFLPDDFGSRSPPSFRKRFRQKEVYLNTTYDDFRVRNTAIQKTFQTKSVIVPRLSIVG